MANRTGSLRHVSFAAARRLVEAVPALQRRMPIYRRLKPAHLHGQASVVEACEPLGLDPDLNPAGAAVAALMPRRLPALAERRLWTIRLSDVSVHGRTGSILAEAERACLSFSWFGPEVSYHNFRPWPSRLVPGPQGPCLTMVHSARGHRHLFHFLYDRLQRLWVAERAGLLEGPLTALTNADLPGFQRVAWEALTARHRGLQVRAIPQTERWAIADLIATDHEQNLKSTFPAREFMAFLRGLYLPLAAGGHGSGGGTRGGGTRGGGDAAPRRLYISRGDTPKRRVTNEAALVAMLERAGFVSVALARLPFAQQVALFAAAEVVVGPHGAGLSHLGFAPEGCCVVELFPANKVKDTYFLLSHRLGLPYRAVVGTAGDRREAFAVPPGQVADALADLGVAL